MLSEDKDLIGDIKYGTQGIVPAPTYFNLDTDTGEITVARDLRQDRRTTYTVRKTLFYIRFVSFFIANVILSQS